MRLHFILNFGGLVSWLIICTVVQSAAFGEESSELKQMYVQDQSDRTKSTLIAPEDWIAISAHDKVHHARVLELLKQDKLQTGEDYYCAAMIMQHGGEPSDYMLAHLFSCVAAEMGSKPAIWLSAASFDRLMQNIGQPQIFGTQYQKKDGVWTLEPLAPDIVPDALRKRFNVPTLEQSAQRSAEMNKMKN